MSHTYLTVGISMAAHAGIRGWLCERDPDSVVSFARSGADVLATDRSDSPDVVIVGYPTHEMPAVDFFSLLREQHPSSHVIVLGDLPGHVIRQDIDAGIEGFVSAAGGPDVLLAAVDAVGAGRTYVDPTLAVSLFTDEGLTARQVQILELLIDGHQNKMMAQKLGIGEQTVKSHISTLLRKLDAASRTELVVRAVQHSFVQIRPTGRVEGAPALV